MKNYICPLVLILLGFSIVSSQAQLLNFDFSITNTTGATDGVITGILYGLQNNASSAPTDIVITSAPTAFGITTPFDLEQNGFTVTSPNFTELTVTNGVVTQADYQIRNGNDHLDLNVIGSYNEFELGTADTANNEGAGFTSVTYTPQVAPEPNVVSLLICGVGVFVAGWAFNSRARLLA
jgi:hypothetical protein